MFDLSIIIVSFNNRDLLKNCLNSIYENVSSTISYEIVVVDNNSQDKTIQMVTECFPGVKVIDNQENRGFAKANNQALKITSGRYRVLLNNDTFVLGGSFEKVISFMDQNRSVGALSPKLLEEDGKTIQLQGNKNKKKIWYSTEPIAVNFICGACFFIREDTYKNVGSLDENFFFYNEDLDWCRRIINHGWSVYYYPDSAVIHYGGKSTGFISSRAIVEGMRGGLYFAYKYYRWIFPLYALLLFLSLFVGAVVSLIAIVLNPGKRKKHWERVSAFVKLMLIIITAKYLPKKES